MEHHLMGEFKLDADARFAADIPPEHQEDVMVMLSEAAQESCEHDDVTILDRDRRDAINVRAHGIIQFGGEEYTFIIEDGNWSGTVLQSWNDGREFEHLPHTQWALEPRADIVNNAIAKGKERFLLAKWDAFLTRPEVASIPGKYSYDRMMQPGIVVERHWKAEADRYGFVLVSQEVADETRTRLLAP